MSLIKILILSLSVCLSSWLYCVNENAGTTGFNNLQVIYSARAMGMARAMTGVTESIEGLQFNPAAILKIDEKILSSTFNSYLVDSNGGSIQLLFPRSETTTVGLMINYLNFGQIDRTAVTQNNEYLDLDDTFGASNIIAGASIAKMMNPAIDMGVTLKYIYDQIDSYSASAVMIDAGLIHHPMNEKIQVGLAIRNLGKQVTYYTDKDYEEGLPFTFAAGLSYQINPKLLGTLDISKPKGSNLAGKFVVEYQLNPMLDLRGGFNSNSADWKTGGTLDWTSGFTFGAGFNWTNYQLDYGLASYGDLGFVNQVSLMYKY
jgi:hypothetical protein